MSDQEKGQAECPFSGHDRETVNVKFFRGRRDEVITVDEIVEQTRSAMMQVRMKTATLSKMAPVSKHEQMDVRDLVANL